MMNYAQVLVFQPVRARASLTLDYEIPAEMSASIQPGVLVVVPVRERVLPGIVLRLTDTPAVPNTRPLHSVLDPDPVLGQPLLDLAHWMARETLAPLHRCIQVMLPPGMRPQPYLLLTSLSAGKDATLPEAAQQLWALLQKRGPLKDAQARRALPEVDVRRARQVLKKRGVIKVERRLRLPGNRPKTVQLIRLSAPPETWEAGLKGLKLAALYQRILRFLEQENAPVEIEVVCAEEDVERRHLEMLVKRGLASFSRQEVLRDPLAEQVFTPDQAPPLLPEQQQVWDAVAATLEPTATSRPPILLLGVTGSGKTEIYLRATARVLEQGRQALILVPEISLTPQTVRRFAVRFPGQVGLWHSGMSDGERMDTWRRVRAGQVQVVVGARSALFAPFPALGLIVLDEEEDSSYKQSRAPYYHTREVAEALAQQAGALLLLGSATPTLESYARARAGRYRLLALPQRIMGHRQRIADWQKALAAPDSRYQLVEGLPQACTIELPPVQVVDMRVELREENRSIFSRALQIHVEDALARRQQVIFFLNRRGTATYVFCRDCGWAATCPRCDVPLTQHAQAAALLCHRCGHSQAMPTHCPVCASARVRAFGLGTEGLMERTAQQWPQARLLRWDRDVAHSHAMHTAIMNQFTRGDADILIGTQMVARGLDIPQVTVVGIISADTALHLPDFRAAERSFQLLAQVAGRSGRGLLGGRVVLQTYHPEHYAVQHAAAHDYDGFAAQELAFRRQAGYPPSIRLARLLIAHPSNERAQAAAEQLAETLRHALREAGLPASDLIGPAPAFFARVRGRYRWQLLLRSVSPADFLRKLDIPPGWVVDVDPVSVL